MSDSENDTRKMNSDSSSGSDSDSDAEQQATKSNTASDQERTTFSDSDEEKNNSQGQECFFGGGYKIVASNIFMMCSGLNDFLHVGQVFPSLCSEIVVAHEKQSTCPHRDNIDL